MTGILYAFYNSYIDTVAIGLYGILVIKQPQKTMTGMCMHVI